MRVVSPTSSALFHQTPEPTWAGGVDPGGQSRDRESWGPVGPPGGVLSIQPQPLEMKEKNTEGAQPGPGTGGLEGGAVLAAAAGRLPPEGSRCQHAGRLYLERIRPCEFHHMQLGTC